MDGRRATGDDGAYRWWSLPQLSATSETIYPDDLVRLVASGTADCSVRAVDAAVAAPAVLLAAWSFTLTGSVFAGADSGRGLDALDEQLRMMLDRYLAP
ncbi:MAG: hypothetical protein ACRDPB_03855 [Nocardioidaceae bacterium]